MIQGPILYIVIQILNLHNFQLQQLIASGDVELNPGPKPAHEILSCVCGTFNQGNIKFGFTAGRQCSCTSLVAVCWATV